MRRQVRRKDGRKKERKKEKGGGLRPQKEKRREVKEAAFGRILKNLTFFWKKESKTKKTNNSMAEVL